MVVRASAVASISGSYNVRAHALSRTHFVKLGGAWRGSLLSPAARKLLRLSVKGSWFWVLTLWQNSAGAASNSARRRIPSRGSHFTSYQIPDKKLYRRWRGVLAANFSPHHRTRVCTVT